MEEACSANVRQGQDGGTLVCEGDGTGQTQINRAMVASSRIDRGRAPLCHQSVATR